MNSFVVIELDTTQPELEIFAPTYTTNVNQEEIRIEATENLDNSWQTTYILDQNGSRYDYTFNINGSEIIGIVNFTGFPLGLATVYIQVRDEVFNTSIEYQKVITIKESLTLLKLDINDFERIPLTINDRAREMIVKDEV